MNKGWGNTLCNKLSNTLCLLGIIMLVWGLCTIGAGYIALMVIGGVGIMAVGIYFYFSVGKS